MDHIRTQTAELLFGPFVYEHHIVLIDRQRDFLREVGLRLFGTPTQAGASTRSSIDDLHLYVGEVEITEAYKAELRALLDQQDQQRLVTQYRAAMEAWITLANTLGAAYGHDVAKDILARDELLAVQPFSALINKIGDVQAGNAGYLHVFNFLHSLIDLPPVSLRGAVLRVNNAAGSEVIKLHEASKLMISNGPSRFVTPGWRPKAIFGGLRVQIELVYHDPLEDKVVALESRVDQLEQDVIDGFEEIKVAVGPDGPIARALRRTEGAVTAARTQIAALKNEVTSQQNQIDALTATARDLKTAVDQL